MKNPLIDKDFLFELDQYKHKEIYAKIISLDLNERPIETIEGKCTGGSISIDGSSAVRRSCNLTMVAHDVNINEFYWGLNTKIQIEIGVRNYINSEYPDIIWFKQGIFVLTTFNTSISTNNYTITLNGKDKMCLLNGEVSGSLPASIDFGVLESYDTIYEETKITDKESYEANKYYIENNPQYTNDTTYTKDQYILATDEFDEDETYYVKSEFQNNEDLTIYNIIREAVHTYGKEPYHNIIVNDLEDYGLELLEYRGDTPLYLLYDIEAGTYTNMTTYGGTLCKLEDGTQITLDDLTESQLKNGIEALNEELDSLATITFVDDYQETKYNIMKIEYGETAGYRLTDLTYAGELVSSIGESLTSILDKIKTMLGDFEYFYDVDGRFIWQKNKTYVNTSWNTIVDSEDDDDYVNPAAYSSAASYSFEDNNLITAFSNTPALSNLKNDFSIWGKREGVTGAEIPIHYRYAIDKKPSYYKSIAGKIYLTQEEYDKRKKANLTSEFISYSGTSPFRRATMPEGLSEDWWEIQDWARRYLFFADVDEEYTKEYYVNLTDAETLNIVNNPGTYYSNDQTIQYINIVRNSQLGAVGKTWAAEDWLAIFPKPGTDIYKLYGNYYNSIESAINNNTKYWCWLFDTGLTEDGKEYIKSIEHGSTVASSYPANRSTGCGHKFYYALERKNSTSYGGDWYQSYIYKPEIPDSIKSDLETSSKIKEADSSTVANYLICDWREIIYQMASDYYKFSGSNYADTADEASKTYDKKKCKVAFDWNCENFLSTIAANNEQVGLNAAGVVDLQPLYEGGITGYEQYYIDLQGFWRQLYDPTAESTKVGSGGYYDKEGNWVEYIETELTETEAAGEDPKAINEDFYLADGEYPYWTRSITSPESLNFWFDFLDGAGDLDKYSVPVVGDRSKVVNDDKVKAIYFRDTANIIFITKDKYDSTDLKSGYTYVFLQPSMEGLFSISAQGKSAKDVLDEYLYAYTYCTESVSITSIPIYYLEPNTRIFVHDEDSKICGDYIVSKFTLPLTYNGTMSITATKAVERLY